MANINTKRIVLTGATRGLGQAMTEGFAEAGCTVLGCGRQPEGVAKMQQKFAAPHRFSLVDITNRNQVEAWAKEVLADGVPDLLVNNAAIINQNAPLWEVPVEEFLKIMDVNVIGMFHVLQAFVPAMVAQGKGVIVNFSSAWGRSTSADVAPYCATKFAVEGLTQALAQDLPAGMAAVPLNPGVIDTDMLRSCFGEGAAAYPDPKTWATRAVPYILSLGPTHNGRPVSVP